MTKKIVANIPLKTQEKGIDSALVGGSHEFTNDMSRMSAKHKHSDSELDYKSKSPGKDKAMPV